MSEPTSPRGPPSLMESRPKRRSIPSSSAAPAPPGDSTKGSQVGVMGNVVESLRRKQEEASTRRQLLILRSKLQKEIRESEVSPSVAVSSEEEAQEEAQEELTEEPTERPTEEPIEEPTEKPTEELTEELTEKPTEELAEEPTEKPTKELAKKDGESDEDAWGRWRGPLEDASSSWHGTTAPMEPPEGPSVDALGRQKERDAAQWTGPTTALGRSSIWYDPEAEEKTVVPEGGAKKKKKKKKESAPAKREEEVPETPPPSEEQLQVQRIQELFQTFGPEETGDLPVEGEMESSSPTVDVLAVPTEQVPATMGPTVPLEPVPETEDAGGEAKKKKRKRRKKKGSQACAGDVVMVEEDPAEGAGGVGDIDLGAGDAGGVETIDVESAGPVDQKKRKKKKGARSWYHRLTPKRTPLWYHRLVCRSGQKKRRKKKKRVRKTAPVEEPSEEEGEQVPEMVPQVPEMVPRVPEMVPRVPEMVPITPAPFPPPAPLEVATTIAAAPMVAAPTVTTQAVAPVAVAPLVVAASQGLKPKPSASPRVRVRASAALPLPPLPPPPPGHVGVYVLPAADPVPDPPRFGPKASGSSQVPKRLEAPPGTPKKAPPKRERERSVSI